jgi:hypothetical protein
VRRTRAARLRRDHRRDPGAGAADARTREELALALFDADRARDFEAKYRTNPRDAVPLLSLLGL